MTEPMDWGKALAAAENERDAARAELGGLRARIEALCDEIERQSGPPYGYNIRHTDLRAALEAAPTSPSGDEPPISPEFRRRQ